MAQRTKSAIKGSDSKGALAGERDAYSGTSPEERVQRKREERERKGTDK
jgi:hypothetical protein